MKNYVQLGDTMDFTTPAGGVVSGTPYMIGSVFGVAANSANAGDTFQLRCRGVFNSLPKTTGEAWTEGEALYWDAATSKLTTTANAGANPLVAHAAVAAAAGDAAGTARLG